MVNEIRRATDGNFVLGGSAFAGQIASTLGHQVVPGLRGSTYVASRTYIWGECRTFLQSPVPARFEN